MIDSHSNISSWIAPNIIVESSRMILIGKFQLPEEFISLQCAVYSLQADQHDIYWLLIRRICCEIGTFVNMARLPEHLF